MMKKYIHLKKWYMYALYSMMKKSVLYRKIQ